MIPEKVKNGLTFYPVPEFTQADSIFGADITKFFDRNRRPDVPQKYNDMASNLFFNGGQMPELSSKIDAGKAATAVKAWLSSWQPAHEAKISTVGYAFWVWSTEEALVD